MNDRYENMKRCQLVSLGIIFILCVSITIGSVVLGAAYHAGRRAGRQEMWEEATAIGAACWTGDASVPAEQQTRCYEWVRPTSADRAEVAHWRWVLSQKRELREFVESITGEHRPVHTKDFEEKP